MDLKQILSEISVKHNELSKLVVGLDEVLNNFSERLDKIEDGLDEVLSGLELIK